MAKKVQLTRIGSWLWTFQRAIDQGHVSPLPSPKWASDTQIYSFSQKFRPTTTKGLLQSFVV